MGISIVNVDPVRDQYAVTNRYGVGGPDIAVFTTEAVFSDDDFPAMAKGQQATEDLRMGSNSNAVAGAHVVDPAGRMKEGTCLLQGRNGAPCACCLRASSAAEANFEGWKG